MKKIIMITHVLVISFFFYSLNIVGAEKHRVYNGTKYRLAVRAICQASSEQKLESKFKKNICDEVLEKRFFVPKKDIKSSKKEISRETLDVIEPGEEISFKDDGYYVLKVFAWYPKEGSDTGESYLVNLSRTGSKKNLLKGHSYPFLTNEKEKFIFIGGNGIFFGNYSGNGKTKYKNAKKDLSKKSSVKLDSKNKWFKGYANGAIHHAKKDFLGSKKETLSQYCLGKYKKFVPNYLEAWSVV